MGEPGRLGPPRAPLRLPGDEDAAAAAGMEPLGCSEMRAGGEEEEEPRAAPAPPPLLLETPARAVELPPCHGHPGPVLAQLPPEREVLLPLPPPPPPEEPPSRGHCLLRNWQEERATNELDRVPGPRDGTEGFFYRHGHQGLLTLQFFAGLARSTTMKDSYRRPWRTGLPVKGQREAMMEWLLYQKYSKEVLEEDVDPPPAPMESLSTTHQHYRQEGFFSVPPAPTQPHNYRMEQPQTFWLEHARQVPGVSHIQPGDTASFKKNASFTTPMAERLDNPLPYGPENYPKL